MLQMPLWMHRAQESAGGICYNDAFTVDDGDAVRQNGIDRFAMSRIVGGKVACGGKVAEEIVTGAGNGT